MLYIIAFVGGIYCNMRVLSVTNVETVIVFRTCSPLIVAVLDYLNMQSIVGNVSQWCALHPTVTYCHQDPVRSIQRPESGSGRAGAAVCSKVPVPGLTARILTNQ